MSANKAVLAAIVAVAAALSACSLSPDPESAPAVASSVPAISPAVSSSVPGVGSLPPDEPIPTAPSSTTPTSATPLQPTSPPPPPETTPAPAVTSSVACDQTDGWLTVSNGRRVLLRAAGLAGPSPTVFVIHGFTGTPTGIERVADLTAAANAAGVAVAYPEGTASDRGGSAWNSGADVFASRDVDDAGALAAMIDAVVATGCVDRQRITVTGESNGAGMTLSALCSPALAGAFRAAVMVIPAVDDGVLQRCSGVIGAVPLSVVAGAIDRTAPLDGGNGLLAQAVWFEQVAATLQRCDSIDGPGPLNANVERYVGVDCVACTELLVVADAPHTWPGTPNGNGGLTPGDFDVNRRIIADALAPQPDCIATR